MNCLLASFERVLQTLWVGGLWGVGYLAVPTVFYVLSDRQQAGQVAGQMFSTLNIVGFICGALLIALAFFGEPLYRRRKVVVVALMVLIVTVSAMVLQPMMQELKAVGLVPGSAEAASFGRLHGVSSVLYLAMSLLGLFLVAFGGRAHRGQTL